MQKPYNLTPEDYATIAKYRRADAGPAAPQIDPRRTEVFRPGPDGKLHPIPGWKTTGPLDVGTWARNIDLGGVAKDSIGILAGAISGANFPKALAPIAGAVSTANEAYDDLPGVRKCDCQRR